MSSKNRFSIVCITFVALALRVYHLDNSSLWWDEIIAINSSGFPAESILQWTLFHEVHPPLFYFLLKGASLFGNSEIAFRSISVFAGIVGVVLMFFLVRRMFGVRMALLAAVALSVFPYHILLSRTPRPYALMVDFEIICMLFIVNYIKSDKVFWLVLLSFVNGIMCFIHYQGFFIVGAQGVFLVVYLFMQRRMSWKVLAWFILSSALFLIPSLFYIVKMLLAKDPMVIQATFRWFLEKFCSNMYVFFMEQWALIIVAACLCIFGCLMSMKIDNTLSLLLLTFVVVPVLMMISVRYGPFFNAWHLFFIIPILCIFASVGFSYLLRDFSPEFIASSLAILVVFVYSDKMYGKNVELGPNIIPMSYRKVATSLGEYGLNNKIVVVLNSAPKVALNWYFRNAMKDCCGEIGKLTASDSAAVINVVSTYDSRERNSPIIKTALAQHPVLITDTISSYEVSLPRHPYVTVQGSPYFLDVHASDGSIFQYAYSSEGLTLDATSEGRAVPVSFDVKGVQEYIVVPGKGVRFDSIVFAFDYVNQMPGGIIKVYIAENDGPFVPLKTSVGPDVDSGFACKFISNIPFEKLRFKIVIEPVAKPLTYYGPDVSVIGLHNIHFSAWENDKLGCQEKYISLLPVSKIGGSTISQEVIALDNVKKTMENGLEVFSPLDSAKAGVIRIAMPNPGRDIGFFPRSSTPQNHINIIQNGSTIANFYGGGSGWSPIGGKVSFIPLPENSKNILLDIVLHGADAQVWAAEGMFFY
ncbi:glycosyltransferase family 39 protein [Solidesulfovibrio magneticus]|uniref:Hypothetical membrane protein n=1 Tax=Solidesulfovibrio magneticus (strain ATCC 700980 / DSM 13731 / RS-1) TaxID=573370 RepID=C4XMF5_SOLM1|nr:glycosyltransferase family 39 protein [Solidesulfovibrio magneticus]BAH74912.1 hypothetical membrane protein [Solidesulfovibrio magneticus RS-1]